MISLKTKYAIKALITLAEEKARGGSSLTIEEIAERGGTPKRFLEHILLEIKRGGLIGSRRGRVGGYVLIKSPESISIGAILRLIDGPMAPLPCLSRGAYQPCADCKDEESCRIRARLRQRLRQLPPADRVADARRSSARRVAASRRRPRPSAAE